MSLPILQKLKKGFQHFARGIKNITFPPHCLSCKTPLLNPEALLLCTSCQTALDSQEAPPLCAHCGRHGHFFHALCPSCRGLPRALFKIAVLSQGSPQASCLLNELHGRPKLASAMASLLLLDLFERDLPHPDLVIPIPSGLLFRNPKKPSYLLAKALASLLDRPYLDLLRRNPPFLRQRLQPIEERRALQNPFSLTGDALLQNRHCLLVDDEILTGKSVNRAAELLLKQGAKSVSAAIWMRTG